MINKFLFCAIYKDHKYTIHFVFFRRIYSTMHFFITFIVIVYKKIKFFIAIKLEQLRQKIFIVIKSLKIYIYSACILIFLITMITTIKIFF